MQLSVSILQQLQRTRIPVIDEALERLGVHGVESTPPSAKVEWHEVCATVERALAATADPTLPLRLGVAMSTWALPTLGLVLMSAPTLRHLFGALGRFAPLVLSDLRFELLELGDDARVHFSPPSAPATVERATVEIILAFSAHCAGELCSPTSRGIRRAFVRFEPPPHEGSYRPLLGFPVLFSAQHNGYVFDRHELDVPLPAGDPALFTILCARAEGALRVEQQPSELALEVKQLLRESDLGAADRAEIARRLELSESSLQRRLHAQGTSLTELLDQVRREIALEQMERGQLSMKQLAERLGFSEPSPFYRAFRRWTGETPQAYRGKLGRR